jgi:hypothetical protein
MQAKICLICGAVIDGEFAGPEFGFALKNGPA